MFNDAVGQLRSLVMLSGFPASYSSALSLETEGSAQLIIQAGPHATLQEAAESLELNTWLLKGNGKNTGRSV